MNRWRLVTVVASTIGVVASVSAQRDSGSPAQPLTIFDRAGHVAAVVGEPGIYSQPAFSPDGTRLAVVKTEPDTQIADVWVMTLSTGRGLRITSSPASDSEPAWSPDGEQLAFISRRNG